MTPEADRHRQHQPQHLADARVAEVEADLEAGTRCRRSTGIAIANWTAVPTQHADRVAVELLVAAQDLVARDEATRGSRSSTRAGERRDREVVVGVEDPDEEPVEPEHHDDREQHAAEPHRQVDELRGERVAREERHDHAGRDDEERRRSRRAP